MEKEYRGQKIIAKLATRLVPPNQNYPDCECMLVLTNQHLYVLEDNFDGTYEAHFEFVLREIDAIEIESITSNNVSGGGTEMPSNYLVTALLGLIGGMYVVPSGKQKKADKQKYIVIHYHTEQGQKERLYFNMYSSGTKDFLKAFQKAKQE